MKTEPQYGEPWQDGDTTVGILNARFDPVLSEKDGKFYTYVEWENWKFKERAIECVNLLAGHDLSTVTIVDNAVLNEVRSALSLALGWSNESLDINQVRAVSQALSKLSPEKK